jgi:hypothetical protein
MMIKLKALMLYICEFLGSNFDREAEDSDPGFMPFASVIPGTCSGSKLK